MIGLALTAEEETLWAVALVVGAVVLVVVVVLMALLLLLLRDVDRGVRVLAELARMRRSDAVGVDLPATAAAIRDLTDELHLHEEVLEAKR